MSLWSDYDGHYEADQAMLAYERRATKRVTCPCCGKLNLEQERMTETEFMLFEKDGKEHKCSSPYEQYVKEVA